ncbi:MAG: type III pantothenate kinase [Desulfurella sp.]|uniref:type III pantothenate kinase n=1 Tax=Desulfurella sp. TaxID=1962857 RepID=UPI003D0E07CA
MLLTIDVGNTTTGFGVFEGKTLIYTFRISTINRTDDEITILLYDLFKINGLDFNIEGAIISSVVPYLTQKIINAIEKIFKVKTKEVGAGIKTGVKILYDNPKEVGADRIVNALAAYEKCLSAAIVVDFGTATTFDCVSEKCEYLGGVIAPGVNISMECLREHTAKLPKISLEKPLRIIGKNTIESMRSGIYFGYIEMVDGIIERLKFEMQNPSVIFTGGDAQFFIKEIKHVDYFEPNLTFYGLWSIYHKNV